MAAPIVVLLSVWLYFTTFVTLYVILDEVVIRLRRAGGRP